MADGEEPKETPEQSQTEPQPEEKDESKAAISKKDGASIVPPPAPRKRGGSKPILKESGIGRVDNKMKATIIQPAVPINQKNYYTEYLRKDDQIMFYRELAEEQKRQKESKASNKQRTGTSTAQGTPAPGIKDEGAEEDDEQPQEETKLGEKTLVLHPGSRNLRLGRATEAYPISIPNVVAHRVDHAEPERMDVDNEEKKPDESFDNAHKVVQEDLATRMKFYKRRVLPNSHQTVSNFNSRMEYEEIPDHNDPYRVEWNNVEEKKAYYTGDDATTIPPDSTPKYNLRWPIKYGMFNENDYSTPQEVLGDISLILVDSLEKKLDINFKQFKEYNVVLIIPDLYDKTYVSHMVSLILGMGFANVCILQESMAATFGAGISAACIIDVGAQKTSVSCVEEGMVISDSRVSLRFGGDDVTSSLVKMLQKSNFPYDTIDLNRQYDWDLANELKRKFATANDADVAVQLYNFYQRSPNEATRKYQFKTFDEVMCSVLGLFYPELFDLEHKIAFRYSLFPRSIDLYDQGLPNDSISDAQINICHGTLASEGKSYQSVVTVDEDDGTKDKEAALQSKAFGQVDQTTIPYVGLDHAIIESVSNAALKSQGAKQSTFYENLMIVGGGAAKFSGFNTLLTDRISMFMNRDNGSSSGTAQYNGDVQVMPIPREMDPEVITWKGGGVYAKLKIVNEVWISAREWDMFGARCLPYKVLFLY